MTAREAIEALKLEQIQIEGRPMRVAKFFEALAFAMDVLEKQHVGEWNQRLRPYEDEIECSACGAIFNVLDNCTEKFHFCPNCGAKMKGGESDA